MSSMPAEPATCLLQMSGKIEAVSTASDRLDVREERLFLHDSTINGLRSKIG